MSPYCPFILRQRSRSVTREKLIWTNLAEVSPGLTSRTPVLGNSISELNSPVGTAEHRSTGFQPSLTGLGPQNRGEDRRFQKCRPTQKCQWETPFDILPEGYYSHLECLLKSKKIGLSCYRERSTC
jgi:hypothetical protein